MLLIYNKKNRTFFGDLLSYTISGPYVKCHAHLTSSCVSHVANLELGNEYVRGLCFLLLYNVHSKRRENWSVGSKVKREHTNSMVTQ